MNELLSSVLSKKNMVILGILVALGLGFLGYLGFLGSLGLGVLIGWYVRPNTRSNVTEPMELEKLRKAAMLENPATEVLCKPEKAQLLKFLLRKATKANRVLVIGFSTGYYTLSIAMSLPPDGEVVACDVTTDLYYKRQCFFQEAFLAKKVDFKEGTLSNRSVISCLDGISKQYGNSEVFDLVFIDVNMILEDQCYEYYEYYWRSLALLRQGGLLVLDIVYCNDRGFGPQEKSVSKTLKTVRDLNIKLHEDTSRVDVLMDLTHDGSDGVIIAEKRRIGSSYSQPQVRNEMLQLEW